MNRLLAIRYTHPRGCAAIVLAVVALAAQPARAGTLTESAAAELRAALSTSHLSGPFSKAKVAVRVRGKAAKAGPYRIKVRLSHVQRAVRRAVRFAPASRLQHNTLVTHLPSVFLGFDDRPITSNLFVSRPLYLAALERIPSSDRSGRRSSRAPPISHLAFV